MEGGDKVLFVQRFARGDQVRLCRDLPVVIRIPLCRDLPGIQK